MRALDIIFVVRGRLSSCLVYHEKNPPLALPPEPELLLLEARARLVQQGTDTCVEFGFDGVHRRRHGPIDEKVPHLLYRPKLSLRRSM